METVIENDQTSELLLEAIAGPEQGEMTKLASATGSYVRLRLRENGFMRKILPPKNITNAELAYLPNTELPAVIDEMEFDSPGARTLPFNESADTEFFYGSKFVTYIFRISTREFTKNVDELRTYKTDPRQILTENVLKDMNTEEDTQFMASADEVVGSVNAEDGASGQMQHFGYAANITRTSYVTILSHLEDLELNNGVFLVNRKTAKEFLRFDRTEIGGDLSQDMFRKGLKALPEFTIMDVPHIATMKRNLVPDNVVYQFAEPNYMGRLYILQDATMYVKKEKDILKFSAMSKLGFSIPNVRSICRTKFAYVPGDGEPEALDA